jgi:hypothetical protein
MPPKLSEERFHELWRTMPDRPEESVVTVPADAVDWLLFELSRISSTLQAVGTVTGSTASPSAPADLAEAIQLVETQIDYFDLRLELEGDALEPRRRQLAARAVEWGGAELRLFVDAAREIVRAVEAGGSDNVRISASSDAPLRHDLDDDLDDDLDELGSDDERDLD